MLKSIIMSLLVLVSAAALTSMDTEKKVLFKNEVVLTTEQQAVAAYIKDYNSVKFGSLFKHTERQLEFMLPAPPSRICDPSAQPTGYGAGCNPPDHWYYASDHKWYECRTCFSDGASYQCCYPYFINS